MIIWILYGKVNYKTLVCIKGEGGGELEREAFHPVLQSLPTVTPLNVPNLMRNLCFVNHLHLKAWDKTYDVGHIPTKVSVSESDKAVAMQKIPSKNSVYSASYAPSYALVPGKIQKTTHNRFSMGSKHLKDKAIHPVSKSITCKISVT